MNKTVKYLGVLSIACLLGLLYSSCVKKENYSIIPAITYNNFQAFCSGVKTDSAYLRVNFTDGDGDIGYPQADPSAPSDFYILPLIYNTTTGKYDTLKVLTTSGDSVITYNYRIPYITPSGTNKALNGIIQINLENLIQYLGNYTLPQHNTYQLQFGVWIYDRAGHKSNVLTTPTVYACH